MTGAVFDRSRIHGHPIAERARAFAAAVRLGWATEANWTDPILFVIFSIAKPVAGALILVAMLEIVGAGGRPEYRAFVVAGSALWAIVFNGLGGLAWSMLDDRERYRMLRYAYVAPADFLLVYVGRGVARMTNGAAGAVVTLAVGVVALGVPFDPGRVDWLLLASSVPIGLAGVVASGVIVAAIVLQSRQEAWHYPEALAGALFLLAGAVFPLAVLPLPVQAAGLLLPPAWWLEAIRASLFAGGPSGIGGAGSLLEAGLGSTGPSPAIILAGLTFSTAAALLAAMTAFRWSEERAKRLDLIDRTSGS